MQFGPLISADLMRRDNRFRVQVQLEGRIQAAHLPNSGRLSELLVAGRRVWLAPADLRRSPQRRTAYDLALVEYAGRLVSVDARLPEHLVAEALRQGRLTRFENYATVQRQVQLGRSRLDFRLDAKAGGRPCWVEVKSVTLVEHGTALFPDAPTLRGQRHVRELMGAASRGDGAAVIFVVQRDDAQRFSLHVEADPELGRILQEATRLGVKVYAWRCQVSLEGIWLADEIPVVW